MPTGHRWPNNLNDMIKTETSAHSIVQPHLQVQGIGPDLVLLHGFAARGDMFSPLLPYLAHYRTWVPDLRGYGHSGHMPGPYTLHQHMQDVITHLAQAGVTSYHLLGYSMGGALAQLIAHHYPAQVKSLMLCCTWSHKQGTLQEDVQHWLAPWALRMIGARRIAHHFKGWMAKSNGIVDPAVAEWYRQTMLQTSDEALGQGAESLMAFDSRPWLSSLNIPTLVVGAQSDWVVPFYHSQQLAKGITGSQFVPIAHAGHGAIFTHTAALGQAVLHFLSAR